MSNLYKQWGVAPKQEGARIINSNAIVAQKIEEMAKKMREQAGTEVDFTDGFSQGLGAENVEAILEEPQADPIEEAKEEAERILSEAKAKADAILNDAQTQKAEILEQAKEEGRTRGYDEGKAKADAEEQEMQRHLQQLEESLNTDYRNKLQHMEQQVVEVVVHVFEKVFPQSARPTLQKAFFKHALERSTLFIIVYIIFYLLQNRIAKLYVTVYAFQSNQIILPSW